MARRTRLTGYRSQVVLSRLGRMVETHKNSVIATTPREALRSALRSLAARLGDTEADFATICVEWRGPVRQHPARVFPVYEVTLMLPSMRQPAGNPSG